MIIKIGDEVHEVKEGPAMLVFTEQELEHIRNMIPGATKYAIYPESWSLEQIHAWMDDVDITGGSHAR